MKKTLLISLALAAVLFVIPVHAQNQNNGNDDQRGQGIEISPPLIELEADPGETVTTEIRLRNVTDVELVAQGVVNDFLAGDESGTPRILFEEDEQSPYSLKEYVTEVPTVTLQPRELKSTEVTINVPEDASPGGHYGVIRFVAVPSDSDADGSAVNLSASIGTLVLLEVSGEVRSSLEFQEFTTVEQIPERQNSARDQNQDNVTAATGFYEYAPASFRSRLSNTGNVHVQPHGTIRIFNMFGKETGTLEFNKTDRNILPDSIRRFNHTFDKEWMAGRYTAQVDLNYGDGENISATTSFWVIPYKMIAIIVILLAAIVFFGRRALHIYKRNVVRKYQQQSGDQNDQPPRF